MPSITERLNVLSNADNLTQDQLETVMAAKRRIEELHAEAREREREFTREAREIAAEARWMERNERDGEPYGTY